MLIFRLLRTALCEALARVQAAGALLYLKEEAPAGGLRQWLLLQLLSAQAVVCLLWLQPSCHPATILVLGLGSCSVEAGA